MAASMAVMERKVYFIFEQLLSNTFGIRIPLLGMEPDALDNNDSKAFRIMDSRKTK